MDRNGSPSSFFDRNQRVIGTLWTLKRGESRATCTLVAVGDGLELRVLVDSTILRWDRCETHEKAFELAERWQVRLVDRGWTRLVPGRRVIPHNGPHNGRVPR